jgi:hypothetical protein
MSYGHCLKYSRPYLRISSTDCLPWYPLYSSHPLSTTCPVFPASYIIKTHHHIEVPPRSSIHNSNPHTLSMKSGSWYANQRSDSIWESLILRQRRFCKGNPVRTLQLHWVPWNGFPHSQALNKAEQSQVWDWAKCQGSALDFVRRRVTLLQNLFIPTTLITYSVFYSTHFVLNCRHILRA